MGCSHRHLVVHRNDAEEHRIADDTSEGTCSCGPAILCPVCDWEAFYDQCLVLAPPELVDEHLITPPKGELN